MMTTIRYMIRLARSMRRTSTPRRRARVSPVLCALALLPAAYAFPVASDADEAALAEVDHLRSRAARVQTMLDGVERLYHEELAPLERVIRTYRDDEALARRVAVALVREGEKAGLEPRLLLAVLLVENPWIDPSAVSPVGAVGLMQVMPFHAGQWKGCEPRLDEIEANVCHGARIFAQYLRESRGNMDRALLRYNGCVRGTNTPNCHQYPQHVYARAGRASLLAWKRSEGAGTSP